MQETKSRDYSAYLAFLETNPEELHALISALTIKLSNFFRNPPVFDLIQSTILPELAGESGFLNAWSIGCAKGEEPYSLAMIVHELRTRGRPALAYHILGTDLDPDAVEQAKKGEYSDEELYETKKYFIEKYFTKGPYQPNSAYGHNRYRLDDGIRSMVRFSIDNIINILLYKKPYLGTYNLIFCRNIMIYMNRDIQEWIIRTLGDILQERGYLVLGETENLPESMRKEFDQPFPSVKIYRKVPLAAAY